MDYTIYKQLIGPINKSCIIAHYNFPSHNRIPTETFSRIIKEPNVGPKNDELERRNQFMAEIPCFKNFEYCVRTCYPLYCGSSTIDVASDAVKKKLQWEEKLNKMRMSNEKKAIQIIENLKKKKETNLPKKLNKYLEHFENDPEPNFKGNYNWLYTGGNSAVSNVNGALILTVSDCTKKSAGFNLLKLNENLNEIDNKLACSLKRNLPILQLISRPKKSDLFIAARQKSTLNLFKVNNASSLKMSNELWTKIVQGRKLLTSVDVSADCETVMVANSKSDVYVYDTETGYKSYTFTNPTVARDNWNQVMFDGGKILMAHRNIFCIFDSRDHYPLPILKYNPLDVTNKCEDICSIINSGTSPYHLYLGTSHSLLQIDIRNGKSIQKWTHLLKNPPQFLNCLENDGDDFILLQSWKINETLGLLNKCTRNGDNIDYHARVLPCALTNIKESLKMARLNGFCLSPHIAKRTDFSVTGLQSIKADNGDIHSFTINSGGDIFLSQITKKKFDEDENEDSDERFLKKMTFYEERTKNPLRKQISNKHWCRVNLRSLRDEVNESRHTRRPRKRAFCWKYHEMFSEESLLTYKDVIATKILKVWVYKPEELELDVTMTSDERVREWMEKMDE